MGIVSKTGSGGNMRKKPPVHNQEKNKGSTSSGRIISNKVKTDKLFKQRLNSILSKKIASKHVKEKSVLGKTKEIKSLKAFPSLRREIRDKTEVDINHIMPSFGIEKLQEFFSKVMDFLNSIVEFLSRDELFEGQEVQMIEDMMSHFDYFSKELHDFKRQLKVLDNEIRNAKSKLRKRKKINLTPQLKKEIVRLDNIIKKAEEKKEVINKKMLEVGQSCIDVAELAGSKLAKFDKDFVGYEINNKKLRKLLYHMKFHLKLLGCDFGCEFKI